MNLTLRYLPGHALHASLTDRHRGFTVSLPLDMSVQALANCVHELMELYGSD